MNHLKPFHVSLPVNYMIAPANQTEQAIQLFITFSDHSLSFVFIVVNNHPACVKKLNRQAQELILFSQFPDQSADAHKGIHVPSARFSQINMNKAALYSILKNKSSNLVVARASVW